MDFISSSFLSCNRQRLGTGKVGVKRPPEGGRTSGDAFHSTVPSAELMRLRGSVDSVGWNLFWWIVRQRQFTPRRVGTVVRSYASEPSRGETVLCPFVPRLNIWEKTAELDLYGDIPLQKAGESGTATVRHTTIVLLRFSCFL